MRHRSILLIFACLAAFVLQAALPLTFEAEAASRGMRYEPKPPKFRERPLTRQNAEKARRLYHALFPNAKIGEKGGPTAGKRFSESSRKMVLNGEKPACVFCGTMEKRQVDHAKVRKLGGNATVNNGQVACSFCNQSKGAGVVPKSHPPNYNGEQKTYPRIRAFINRHYEQ